MLAVLASSSGDILLNLAIFWDVYATTRSTAALALLGITGAVPVIVLGLIGGTVVDRYDRRRLLIGCDLARVCCLLLFLLLQARAHIASDFAMEFAENAASTVFSPARGTIVPCLVPRDKIVAANSRLAAIRQAGQLFAWGSGGWLVVAVGVRGVALADVGSFLVSLACLILLYQPLSAARRPAHRDSLAAATKTGLGYVRATPWLRTALLLFAAAGLASAPLWELAPAYVGVVLRGGSSVYGEIRAAIMVGVVIGSLAAHRLARIGLGRLLLGGIALMGICYALVGHHQSLAAGLAVNVGCGIGIAAIQVAVFSMIQSEVPRSLQGRVLSLLTTVDSASAPIGLAVAGPLASQLGVAMVFRGCGLLLTAVSVAGCFGVLRARAPARIGRHLAKPRPWPATKLRRDPVFAGSLGQLDLRVGRPARGTVLRLDPVEVFLGGPDLHPSPRRRTLQRHP